MLRITLVAHSQNQVVITPTTVRLFVPPCQWFRLSGARIRMGMGKLCITEMSYGWKTAEVSGRRLVTYIAEF